MRILLRFSLGFAGAALLLLGLFGGAWLPGLLLTLGALIATAAFYLRGWKLYPVALGLAVGLLWSMAYSQFLTAPADALDGATMEISATALDYSIPTAYGIRVDAQMELEGYRGKSLVWLYTDEALSPGDRFTVTARLEKPGGDYLLSDRADGIHLLAYGSGTPEIRHAERTPLRFLPRRIAHALEISLERAMPEDTVGYAVALTTGNRDGLSRARREDLQRSGIYHALALSGMHLSVLMGFLSLPLYRRKLRAGIGIPLCIAFAIITGARPSIVRAAIMQCLILLAPLSDREADPPTSLGAAGLLLLGQNPWCIFGWGLQLSFASMAGILLISEKLRKWMLLKWKRPRGKVPRALRRGICVSLATMFGAVAGTAPLMMLHFGYLSLISPLTNLLTIWAVEWCFRGSLITALIGTALPPVAEVLGWGLSWLIRYVELVAYLLARVPFAAISTRSVYGAGWVVATYGIWLCGRLLRRDRGWMMIPACCTVFLLFLTLGFTVLEGQGLEITMLDVGQGQSLLFRCQDQTLVVDCGGSLHGGCGDLAANSLLAVGETRVDALILTHYDQDHTDGVEELLERMPVDRLLIPDMEPENPTRRFLEQEAAARGMELYYVNGDTLLSFATGRVQVFPPMDNRGENSGLSVLVDVADVQTLVTGDMSREEEQLLLSREELPDLEILVAGHHGSKDSTGRPLLEATRPELVLISVGKNRYGHPGEETLARILAAGAEYYRTDESGDIRVRGGRLWPSGKTATP